MLKIRKQLCFPFKRLTKLRFRYGFELKLLDYRTLDRDVAA